MRVELHTQPGALSALQEEWAALLPRSHCDTLFLHPAWQEAWWRTFGEAGALRLLTVRDEAHRLVGLAPFFLARVTADASEPLPRVSVERPATAGAGSSHCVLMLIGGTEVSDYLDVVVDRSQAPAVYQAILTAVREEIDGWEWIDLQSLPAESPSPAFFAQAAPAAGWSTTVGPDNVCPYIALPGSWEDYLALLGKKERHELRRKTRKLEQYARPALTVAGDPATLEADLATFMALHEASAPDKADFMRDPRMRDFFRLITYRTLEQGWLDLSFLSLDGQPAASMYCFRYGDAVLVYNSGFDPQAWPSLSPGIVLLGYRIKEAIASGRCEFDFLQGNERYKYDFGAQDRVVRRLVIRRS